MAETEPDGYYHCQGCPARWTSLAAASACATQDAADARAERDARHRKAHP